jgi:plasmid maintenance system antidote protein VapI
LPRRAVASLGEIVSQVLKETGMAEDELAEKLDVRWPRAQ